VHPLTPYRHDPKHQNPPLSLKGQPGGVGYRHWLGLTWQDESNGNRAALVVQYFNSERSLDLSGDSLARLWSFGYDMDNMKARCWYESTLPLLAVPPDRRNVFLDSTARLLDAAKEAISLTRSFIKAAWFSRPKDTKGDMGMVDHGFWHNTEKAFYEELAIMAKASGSQMMPDVAERWLSAVKHEAGKQFDHWALEGNAEDLNMKRIIKARNGLQIKLHSAKPFKILKQIATSESEAA
jgi:CRISPR system Cascade subunit CasA